MIYTGGGHGAAPKTSNCLQYFSKSRQWAVSGGSFHLPTASRCWQKSHHIFYMLYEVNKPLIFLSVFAIFVLTEDTFLIKRTIKITNVCILHNSDDKMFLFMLLGYKSYHQLACCMLHSSSSSSSWGGVGKSKPAGPHPLRLCTNSKSDLCQTLTWFLSTLNNTPITALLNTVTGFHSVSRLLYSRCVCEHAVMCMSVDERWPSAYMSVPLCINHLTRANCWPWISASTRGSRWQCICLSHNGWYTKRAVIWQKCSPNGSRVRQRLAKGRQVTEEREWWMATSPGWSHQPQTLPHGFFKTENIAWIRAAISAAVGEMDGQTGAYCALSSGAAL